MNPRSTDMRNLADSDESSPLLYKSNDQENTIGFKKFLCGCCKSCLSENSSSSLYSILILANVVLGTGLLNFAKAYSDAGGIPQVVAIQVVCLLFLVGSLMLTAHCVDLCGLSNYQNVVKYFAGTPFFIFCNIIIFVHNFGTCVAFLIIIGDQVDQVMSLSYGSTFCHHWYLSRPFTIPTLSVLFILPLLFPKRIDGFKFSSILGIMTTLYIVVLTFAKCFSTHQTFRTEFFPRNNVDWRSIFLVVPTICFSFESHIEAVPLYAIQKKRKLSSFFWVILGSTLISVIIYNIVGCAGYLTFGSSVASDLLVSYYPDIPVLIGMAMAALKSATTYPVVFYCARIVVDDGATILFNNIFTSASKNLQHYIVTIFFFTLSVLMALFIPSIGEIIAVLGASGALFIFFFPGLCCVRAYQQPRTWRQLVMLLIGVIFVTIGVFVATVTYVQGGLHYKQTELIQREVYCT